MTAKRMLIMLILTGIVFGAVFGMKWFGNQMMVQYLENMPVPTETISAAEVTTLRWENRLEAIGTLTPVNGADLTAEVAGTVTAVYFESGQMITKGERLISLDARDERGELQRLQAQAQLAELNRKRREQLVKLEAISKSDYDGAVAEANAAKAAVDAQAARLALKELRAPFSGRLGIRRVNIGQYVSPGAAIVTLQSLDPIDVDFSLPEQHISRIEPGFSVNVTVESVPDLPFKGEVLAIEPRIDTATRNFGIRARLANPDGHLRAGQFARIVLTLPGEREVLAIPRTAVEYSSFGTSVYVVQAREAADADANAGAEEAADDQPTLEVVQRFVRIGDARGDYVVVLEGLETGDRVATSGLMKLRNQQPVIINNDLAPNVQLEPKTPQT